MNIKSRHHFGFSLVEVTLALGLATYCLVAVSGLLSVGINSGRTSNQQTAATNLVKSVVADLRATPASSNVSGYTASPQFGFRIPDAGQGGSVPSTQTVYFNDGANATGAMGVSPVAGSEGSRYRVSVVFNPPASGVRAGTSVRILVTWPAAADPNPGQWPTRYAGSLEILTALDRN